MKKNIHNLVFFIAMFGGGSNLSIKELNHVPFNQHQTVNTSLEGGGSN